MDGPNREKRINRILERVLTRRASRFPGITLYKEGFVSFTDLEKFPRFANNKVTTVELKKVGGEDTAMFTIKGEFIKANDGHKFDVTDEKLSEVPVPVPATKAKAKSKVVLKKK